MDRLIERFAVVLLAFVVTAIFAWLRGRRRRRGRPSRPRRSPSRAAAGPTALEVRLARPPAPLDSSATIEGKLDPGPLVGSDRGDVVALALAALPASESMGMVVRRNDDLTGNFLVPLGFAGGDSKTGLLLDPTGSGAGTPGKATFMGAEAMGRRFLIIADRSGSMSGEKFERVVAEINATVKALKPGAKFYVIFYDDTALPYPGTRWLSGRRDAASLEAWMAGLDAGGTTNPLPAFQIAFTQVHPGPDAIFFMTDGLFAPTVAEMIPALNSARRVVPIHTISFVDKSAEPWLRKIAEDFERDISTCRPRAALTPPADWTWLAKPAAAWLLIAISPLAWADEIVMRPGMRLKDKQVYSFDEDGVLLGPASRPIGWEAIEGGTLARDQARFDRLRRELGGRSTRSTPSWPMGRMRPCSSPPRRSFPGLRTGARIRPTWWPRRSCGRTWRATNRKRRSSRTWSA